VAQPSLAFQGAVVVIVRLERFETGLLEGLDIVIVINWRRRIRVSHIQLTIEIDPPPIISFGLCCLFLLFPVSGQAFEAA
jgi:hypothetical protein